MKPHVCDIPELDVDVTFITNYLSIDSEASRMICVN